MEDFLLDRAVRQHGDDEREPGLERHELHVAQHRGVGGRSDHDRGVLGEVREELARLVEQVFEREMRGREEVGDGAALGRGQTRRPLEVVDEEAVAAVGRDATGRGVRLHQVALTLEDRHVVAHGRARDPEVPGRRDRLGSDRLRSRDVLLHDRTQHPGAPLVEGRSDLPLVAGGALGSAVFGRHAAVPCPVEWFGPP